MDTDAANTIDTLCYLPEGRAVFPGLESLSAAFGRFVVASSTGEFLTGLRGQDFDLLLVHIPADTPPAQDVLAAVNMVNQLGSKSTPVVFLTDPRLLPILAHRLYASGGLSVITTDRSAEQVAQQMQNIVKVVGLGRSSRKRMFELNTLFNTASVMIIQTDLELRIKRFNRHSERVTEYFEMGILGRRLLEVLFADVQERERIAELFAPLLAGESNRVEFPARLRSAGGTERQVLWTAIAYVKDPNWPQSVTHVVEDVTENEKLRNQVDLLMQDVREKTHRLSEENEFNEALLKIVKQYTPRATWMRAMEVSRAGQMIIPDEVVMRTFLFTDVINFTSYASDVPPQEVLVALNGIFSFASRIVYINQGDIDKFVGDAMFCIFEDPYQAVKSALEIQHNMTEFNAFRELMNAPGLQIRIGINTGTVIRGNVGGEYRKDNTVIGDAVNLASRLENACDPGAVLISDSTYQLVKDRIATGGVSKLRLKGKEGRISAYRVTGFLETLLDDERSAENA